MIRKNSELTYALKYASKELRKGIEVSKREIYRQNNGRSPYIHSWSTFNRYMGVAKDFVKWCKERNINRLDKVNYNHIREYLEKKNRERGIAKNIKSQSKCLREIFFCRRKRGHKSPNKEALCGGLLKREVARTNGRI